MNARRFIMLVMVGCMALVATACGGNNAVTYRTADCAKAQLNIKVTATWHDNGGRTGPEKVSVVVTCNGVPAKDVDVKITFPGGLTAKVTTDANGAGSASQNFSTDQVGNTVTAAVNGTDGTQTASAKVVAN